MKLAWDSKAHQVNEQKRKEGKYVRERSDDLYHTARWTKVSRAWRMSHPLCEECKRHGIIKEADVVDHIVPFPVCEDFFDESNFQSLCEECNRLKGQRDKAVIAAYRHSSNSTGGRGV